MLRKNHTIMRGHLYAVLMKKDWSTSTTDRVLKVILTRYSDTDPWEPQEKLAEQLLGMLEKADSEEAMLWMLDKEGM